MGPNADHASVAHLKGDRRVVLDLNSAALSTPELALQYDDTVAGVDEPLGIEAALVPSLKILFVNGLPDLLKAAHDAALPNPADRAMKFNCRIECLLSQVPLPQQHRLVGRAHKLDVLLRHRLRSISRTASRGPVAVYRR